MQSLYKQILTDNKNIGLTEVGSLIGDNLTEAKAKLQLAGFNIGGLSNRQIALLFFALVDILFIVKGDSFYLATLSFKQIEDLKNKGRLLQRRDDTLYSKTNSILAGNTVEVVNKFLASGKFHLIKLMTIEDCIYSSFYCQLSTMNPYPSLDKEKVYTLSDVHSFYKSVVTKLVRGTCTINKSVICSSYMKDLNFTCTCGYVFAKSLDGDLVKFPIWSIDSVEAYAENSNLEKLLNGVCIYKGDKVTLNRKILEEYYGSSLYELESRGVRYRCCLEEILSNKQTYNLWYYIRKFKIDGRYETLNDLKRFLMMNVPSEYTQDPKTCKARKLCPIGQIGTGKKSFYSTIKLNDVELEVMKDYTEIMPKVYTYYAISGSFGYNSVKISATSDNLALSKGEEEFKRQFGKIASACLALEKEGKLIKGNHTYKFSIDTQRQLCQNIMYGYTENYSGYAKYLKELAKSANLPVMPTDDMIQYLYINKLAMKYKHGADVEFIDVVYYMLEFFELLQKEGVAIEKLHESWRAIAIRQIKKEYKTISANFPNLNDYVVTDEPSGQYIITNYGKYKVLANGISKSVLVRYKDVDLGTTVVDRSR